MPAPFIMYLTAGFWRAGGVEVYLLHYATEMRRRGFDARIVVCDPLPAKEHWCLREVRERGISITSLASRGGTGIAASLMLAALWRLMRTRSWSGWSAVRRAVEKRSQVAALRHLLRHAPPDVIHVKGRIATEFLSCLPVERTIFHVATSGACDDSWTVTEIEAFRPFIEGCARVFAPGTGVAERFKREFCIERPVDVIFTMSPDDTEGPLSSGIGQRSEVGERRTVCLEQGRKGDREPGTRSQGPRTKNEEPSTRNQALPPHLLRFGFVGRLVAGKGVLETIEALRLLKSVRVEPAFVFVGDGPLVDELQASIARYNLTNVTMAGVLPPREAVAQMDVLVLASESEAMPLVLVEALAAGHPCIATAVGGIPDLIRDGVEGFLLADRAPATIAAAIERFLKMPSHEFAGFVERARCRYEECCTPEAVGNVVEEVYRRVLGA